jgi:hypothetical protein
MAATVVSTLVEEVADLLRHDNLDSRILTWMTMTFNDMVNRMNCWRFNTFETVTCTGAANTEAFALTKALGDPIAMIFQDKNGKLQIPQYRTWRDFTKYSHRSSQVTADVPEIWSIGPSPRYAAVGDAVGKAYLYFYPILSTGTNYATLISSKTTLTGDQGTTNFLEIPFHMEHCLVWGSAWVGSRLIRPQLAQLYQTEYEQALRNISLMLNYHPDSVPVRRSITGPYTGSVRLNTMPRIPEHLG